MYSNLHSLSFYAWQSLQETSHGLLLEVLLFLVLRLDECELGLKLVDLDGEMSHILGVVHILKQSGDQIRDDVTHCRLFKWLVHMIDFFGHIFEVLDHGK